MSKLSDLLMPKLGLTMTEGTLAEWCVAPGDRVQAGEVMFLVETDKAVSEITADAEGELREILVQQGECVPVGTVVARWTGPGKTVTEPTASADNDKTAGVPARDKDVQFQRESKSRIIATPLARRLAHQHGIDLRCLSEDVGNKRIKAADVREVAARRSRALTEPPEGTDAASLQQEKRPAGKLMEITARRMVEAKQVPHFYLSVEAEVTKLLALRERLNAIDGRHKLTLNDMLLSALVRALEATPGQNRIYADGDIVQYHHIDVGIAVNSDAGLLAPVLHDLRNRSLYEICARARALTLKARKGHISHEDTQGGAITLSNAGMYGVTYITPIINPPQSAILGVGSVREVFRPDTQGQPQVRREMALVLAADHRIHDGASGMIFLNRVVAMLENPYQLMQTRAQSYSEVE